MPGDLISLRILAVFGAQQDHDLLRSGCAAVSVPVDLIEAGAAAVAVSALGRGDIDLILLDAGFAGPDRAAIVAAARAVKPIPLVILVGANRAEAGQLSGEVSIDGGVIKPKNLDEAKTLIERACRVRRPTRLLVVDDSPTTRSIIRKIAAASRFLLDIAEAAEGLDALKQLASGTVDVVILDYNMPGLNGVETLMEIKRQYPRVAVVIMTSTPDEALALRARAVAFLKKPFFPSDIDAVLCGVFGLRVR
jgi:CheY-like chemotaxis protein